MPNALTGLGSPPIPNQQGQQQPAATAPQGPPAPTHAQTVAALRHFQAVMGVFGKLQKNPDLGKADIRSAVIDGVTGLVAQRIIPPGAAVEKLATLPDRPFEQKQWVEQQILQDRVGRAAILVHHTMAHVGEPPEQTPGSDTHLQDISGMMQGHYGKRAA